ncbi:MAG TPA: S8 family peptidase [Terriglobia bacterium]|nr:S8 family peptidase [Terriglobia bacterium]
MSGPHHIPSFKSFVISGPVKRQMEEQAGKPAPQAIPVIISLRDSKDRPELGVGPAKDKVKAYLAARDLGFTESDFYIFAALLPDQIEELAKLAAWVYQIWKDEAIYAHLLQSTETVKAAPCWRTFDARGQGITWAVMDTGIHAEHPHFATHGTVDASLSHNFSISNTLDDLNGHGTHVAGIIAGRAPEGAPARAARFLEEQAEPEVTDLPAGPSGVAPLARLVNVKVLNDDGTGSSSTAIRALEYLRKVNDASQATRVDGVNMSLGYPYDPQSYGCGYSPLCEEVTRAVNSGLIVVISCGNWGYGRITLDSGQQVAVSVGSSITDPANTEAAIVVGSVHKSAPHRYGVSYFSSKGPTGDGRMKPDLVAPGEKVISCSVHLDKGYAYEEMSGTSAAAPHVSGAIAAFLSGHPEFRADPERVKAIFLKTATDLGRDRAHQGAGLVDLFRAMTSV